MQTKYVFVTGGVVSGLGKGITVASLGRLLKSRGFKVITQKFDPYLNIDPGNLNPYEHGEVFVTDDGAETDLDLGHYERFIDESLSVNNSMTMGKIYWSVLNKERKDEYNGATVQVIPHITNEIKECICKSGNGNIVITEVGGTVGDIESLPILEAIRQIAHDVGRENVVFVHITLVPHLDYIGEMKTKPTQHSVKELLSRGIQPDIIVCRSDRFIPQDIKEKLALFCNVETRCVVQNTNSETIYEVPLQLEEEKLADTLCLKLKLEPRWPDLAEWRNLVNKHKNPSSRATIGIVGQHAELWDAYLSVAESLNHAGIHQSIQVNFQWISEKDLNNLSLVDGIVLAGSVNEECSPWKSKVVEFAREKNIPFFGIGAGMRSAVKSASDEELSTCIQHRGSKTVKLPENSKAFKAYGVAEINERFRNLYEINHSLRAKLEAEGWIISEGGEVAELTGHPWFVCVQFHPEYKSRLTKASPLFESFLISLSSSLSSSC